MKNLVTRMIKNLVIKMLRLMTIMIIVKVVRTRLTVIMWSLIDLKILILDLK